MRAECVDAVQQAIGRALTKPEIKGIEDRIRGNMRQLARQDPQAWRGLTDAERLTRAAETARDQLVGEAGKRQQRVGLQVEGVGRVQGFIADAVAAGARPFEALYRWMELTDVYRKGIEREYFSRMVDTMQAVNGRLLGLIEDATVSRAIVQEIFGRDSGSQVAQRGAAAWLETVEAMRSRFNAAGGDVGQLDYGYIPQPHDQVRVQRAGADRWAQEVLPLLDRARYYTEDGAAMTDAQLLDFLRASWDSIQSAGLNKVTPGAPKGTGMLANRGSASRQIHFAGPDEYLAYMQAYGRPGVLSAMQSHVGRLARDIALVERFGPNPDAAFRTLYDVQAKTGDSPRVLAKAVDVQKVWDLMSGKLDRPQWAGLADIAQGARNIEVATKLGGALLSSVTDFGTLAITAGFNRLPILTTVANAVRAFGSSDMREFANRAGLIGESMISDMNRWAEGNVGPGWTAKAARATMKLSFMEAWTDSLRRGFSVTMMGALGRMSRTEWSALDGADRAHLERAGITQADFDIWRAATPEQWRGSAMLTPESIRALPDAAIDPAATAPPVPPGSVRFYHGGDPKSVTGSLWFTADLRDAQGWAGRSPGMRVWYVDVPKGAKGIDWGDPANGVVMPTRQELDASIAGGRQPFELTSAKAQRMKDQAVTKLLAYITDESEYAVVNPDLSTRAIQAGGTQKGTVGGEVWRSVTLFKSFPIAMVTRHWNRMLNDPTLDTGGRLAYGAAMLTSMTALGYASMTAKDLANGRDPRSLTDPATWAAAFAQGGGIGIVGDFFLTDANRFGQSFTETLAGPLAGTLADLHKVTIGNFQQAAKGEDTKAEAELLNFLKARIPPINLWYTKAVVERAFVHDMQEALSPGYLRRMEQRARRDMGQDYWWRPGELEPGRAPDMTAMVREP